MDNAMPPDSPRAAAFGLILFVAVFGAMAAVAFGTFVFPGDYNNPPPIKNPVDPDKQIKRSPPRHG